MPFGSSLHQTVPSVSSACFSNHSVQHYSDRSAQPSVQAYNRLFGQSFQDRSVVNLENRSVRTSSDRSVKTFVRLLNQIVSNRSVLTVSDRMALCSTFKPFVNLSNSDCPANKVGFLATGFHLEACGSDSREWFGESSSM
ncbi:hypothetical protein LR48_Vigan03g166800 [Vigna angularis]|uniref:Uncharacterized protein n=1 Tax=Phaseolus angularis TaxID=3914 RepID=A0A0L9U690_PHAAN|nr:hypothetical protein LR48_Vigan03g166800 [Vigna angularis]